jgi:hypothetical protein
LDTPWSGLKTQLQDLDWSAGIGFLKQDKLHLDVSKFKLFLQKFVGTHQKKSKKPKKSPFS